MHFYFHGKNSRNNIFIHIFYDLLKKINKIN
nr:MAG TPA_asm: hypothetical protein [Caudoviricetes sp.]